MPEALLNLSFSYRSRTKVFTTRMAEMFSCTLAFRSSYFWNTSLKMRSVTTMMDPMTATRNTTAMKNMALSRGLMYRHMA